MLWTDAAFVTPADLDTVDPDITEVASSQSITLTDNISRGIEEAGQYLEGVLVSFTTYISSNDLSSNHLSAVFYTGSAPNQRRRATLDQVVVTGRNASNWAEIKQWAVNRCLTRFYLTAGNRAEGDRYLEKAKRYREEDRQMFWPMLQKSGIPIVYRPMPTPAATLARNPGAWAASAATLVGGTVVGNVDVAITYVDSTRYVSAVNDGNLQSNPSAAQIVALTAGNGVQVDITGLNPPSGQVDPAMIARGFTVFANADSYNVWVANPSGSKFVLQNASPIPISQKVYSLAADPITSSLVAGLGQYADVFLTTQNLIQRG